MPGQDGSSALPFRPSRSFALSSVSQRVFWWMTGNSEVAGTSSDQYRQTRQHRGIVLRHLPPDSCRAVQPIGDAPLAGKTVQRRFTNIWKKDGNTWCAIARHANVVSAQ